MSKYTTEVRFICESKAGLEENKGFDDIAEIIDNSYDKIFDFDYPIFDEAYKPVLEKKILKFYYAREICAETVGLWKHFLDVRMNEIMPYYNKLYQSELLEFNPFYDADYTRSISKEGEENGSESASSQNGSTRTDNTTQTSRDSGSDTSSNTSAVKNDHWDYYSDTPQGAVTNLANNTYLTNARHITDDGTGTTGSETTNYGKTTTTTNTGTVGVQGTSTSSGTNTITTTQDYLEHVSGKMPGYSFSKALMDYRNTFLNIDKRVIDDLSDLFFTLW